MIGVSVETVWRYTRTGRIPSVRLGNRKYRYYADEVVKALQGNVAPLDQVRERRPPYVTEKPFTYDDYLKLPNDDGFRYQVLEGYLVKEPAPYVQHQRTSRRLQRALEDYFLKIDPKGEVFNAPTDVTLSDVNVVQPDLLYVPSHLISMIDERRINGAPHLVIEIVSLSSRAQDRIKKFGIYERMQVPHYWIVDYEAETIECYGLQNDFYVLRSAATSGEELTHPDFPGLQISLSHLWRPYGP